MYHKLLYLGLARASVVRGARVITAAVLSCAASRRLSGRDDGALGSAVVKMAKVENSAVGMC